MDTYAVHLAMAALVGASVVAVSAYYMHRKTLNQLLEFAKTIERDREREDVTDEGGGLGGGGGGGDDSTQYLRKYVRRNLNRRKGYRRASASLPDVTAISGEVEVVEEKERRNGPVRVDSIPAGLPRLHTLPEGIKMSDFTGTIKPLFK